MQGQTTTTPRMVMVVADPTRESSFALQYALSHVVSDNDTLILFHVENPNARKNPFAALFKNPLSPGGGAAYSWAVAAAAEGGGGEVDSTSFLEGMKRACEKAKPKVIVMVKKAEVVDGVDKASTILSVSETFEVDVLVVGQRRKSNALLGSRRGLSLRGFDTADYLVENSKCTCVAVQKREQNAGYLLNSKALKNFWLLA